LAAAQCYPQTKASQRVCLPSPEKEILQNAPQAIEKKDNNNDTNNQIWAFNPVTTVERKTKRV